MPRQGLLHQYDDVGAVHPDGFPAAQDAEGHVVQVFGTRKSPDTRKALRFFAERRITTHFVDLNQRPASPGELRRFAQKFGVPALVDRASPRFLDLGLAATRLSDERWLERLAAEPLLLKMPLVRFGPNISVGLAEDAWRQWLG